MVKFGTGKGRGVMTDPAVLVGRNMRRIGLGCLTGRIGTVVAGIAADIGGDRIMVEYRGGKATTCGMTDATILAVSRNMTVIQAYRWITIMTTITAHAGYLCAGVIDKIIGKGVAVVAGNAMTRHTVRLRVRMVRHPS